MNTHFAYDTTNSLYVPMPNPFLPHLTPYGWYPYPIVPNVVESSVVIPDLPSPERHLRRRCPPLTQEERMLLNTYGGCTRCRRFVSGEHECYFPSPVNYRPITLATLHAAQRASINLAQSQPQHQPKRRDTSSRKSEDCHCAPLSSPSVSAPSPATTDSSAESESPLSVPHLVWAARVFGQRDFPHLLQCLLDSGAHINLIRPEVVIELGLRRRRLNEPVPITLALHDPASAFGGEPPLKYLTHYVELTLSTENLAWSSHTVRAIVAPGLCTTILLGTPFLHHNRIILDVHECAAVHKPSGCNLLDVASFPMKDPPKKTQANTSKLRRIEFRNHRREMLDELRWVCEERKRLVENRVPGTSSQTTHVVASIKSAIENLALRERLDKLEAQLKEEFRDVFQPIPHADLLPSDVLVRIKLKDETKPIQTRNYNPPRALRDKFHELIHMRLQQGFIRLSDSPHVSPSFVVPKADPNALPRWVCDYRQLNDNTVPDSFCLPRIDDILADMGKGKIWSTLDMTDSFFQTKMHPDDIAKTAVATPFGNYEWLVMPMGFKNSPAVQQRRVTGALRNHLGKSAHVFLDDIGIWAESIDDHIVKLRGVLQSLREAKLHVNPKKVKFFQFGVKFLGHYLSQDGIQADQSKVDKILEWPIPQTVTQVRQFLGLVRYISAFLPKLAPHTKILNALTAKEYEKNFPLWTQVHHNAFESIKQIVVSRECLTVIDHDNMAENKIYLTTDASDFVTGAVLAFGPTWETARPVAFDSEPLHDAELNYPVHEKELLAIIRALDKWKADLLGAPFFVYTDHKTLLNFHTQRDLSRRQARWMEKLAIYDCKFVYVQGEDNTVADALSRLPIEHLDKAVDAQNSASHPSLQLKASDRIPILDVKSNRDTPFTSVCALSASALPSSASLEISEDLLNNLRDGYKSDAWCQKLISAASGMPELTVRNGLWFLGERLIVPNHGNVREHIFRLAHDTLGHFGFFKTYEAIRNSYFWPNMRKDLEEGYIPSCPECQRNKASTSKPSGPLHPLPVPDERCESVSLDFIGPLPMDDGCDCILTITDRLGSDVRVLPCSTKLTAEQLAVLFFDNWYCENGLPKDFVSDQDKLFMSKFFKHLCTLAGIDQKTSTAFHPQSNGASERTNKTVIQSIRFHVSRNQQGWKRALPRIRFQIMTTVNKSTGYTPFQLRFGRAPRVLPPLIPLPPRPSKDVISARQVIEQVQTDVANARDNLMVAKINQAHQANQHRGPEVQYKVGDMVMLKTENRRKKFKAKGQDRVAKFMPRYDGPFLVTDVHRAKSTITVYIPNAPNLCPTFHTALVKPFKQNDDSKFPMRTLEQPGPIEVDGQEEHFIDCITDHKQIRGKTRYYVQWRGYGRDHDEWLNEDLLEDTEALETYKQEHGLP